ncbi:hypothetical protein ABT143_34955 [Streptomyces sp. NPDC002033]|uniref:hypothetical protein n=1 Tax=unclassified Streptomyces TaxID=2593676 RepID=UPI00331C42EC
MPSRSRTAGARSGETSRSPVQRSAGCSRASTSWMPSSASCRVRYAMSASSSARMRGQYGRTAAP